MRGPQRDPPVRPLLLRASVLDQPPARAGRAEEPDHGQDREPEGVRNLSKIARFADAIVIDRGDLSREVRLEAIPLLQKAIIRKANALGVPVYVATNLLESMVTRRTPTRAEVNDVMNTLLDGANGLVLAAETAIGNYPVEAARMIVSLMREYEASIEGYRVDDLLGDHPLALERSHRGVRSNL